MSDPSSQPALPRDDVRVLDTRAVQLSVVVVRAVTPDRLGAPTPCSGWDLRALLGHMAGQHHGFAAAAEGETQDASVFAPVPIGDSDPIGIYVESAERVQAAFDRPDILERPFWLPEIRTGEAFPGRLALSFHFLDYVLHSWDVALALGIRVAPAGELVEAALEVAKLVPAGEARTRSGAAFGPVTVTEESGAATPLDELLALSGRSPTWHP